MGSGGIEFWCCGAVGMEGLGLGWEGGFFFGGFWDSGCGKAEGVFVCVFVCLRRVLLIVRCVVGLSDSGEMVRGKFGVACFVR